MQIQSGEVTHEELRGFNLGVAKMVSEQGSSKFFHAVFQFIDSQVPVSHPQVWYYRRGIPPQLLGDQIDPLARQGQIDQYLEGPYAQDPAYIRTVDAVREGAEAYGCHLGPDVLEGEYYDTYYVGTNVIDEYVIVIPQSLGGINVSVMRTDEEAPFSESELIQLDMTVPTIAACAGLHVKSDYWARLLNLGPEHQIEEARADFGKRPWAFRGREIPALSDVEKSVVDLMVQGFSPEQTAERLDIPFETVRSRKKAIFSKLGATKQADVFAAFIEFLSQRA